MKNLFFTMGLKLLDIAFQPEASCSNFKDIFVKHRGTWEHFPLMADCEITVQKFAAFSGKKQIGNVQVRVSRYWHAYVKLFITVYLVLLYKPNVIIVHSTKYPFVTWLLKKLSKKTTAVYLQLHGDLASNRKLVRKIKQLCFGDIDGILSTGRGIAEQLASAGVFSTNTPIFEIMEGSCSFIPRPDTSGIHAPSLQILWVGRSVAGKDPMTLIEAVALLKTSTLSFSVSMLCGEGPLQEKIVELINYLDLQQTIKIVSKRQFWQMEDLYHQHNLFVSTSLFEGSGWALCEAMAGGLCTVVTAIPSHCWMTQNGRCGALFEPGNAQQLSEQILACSGQIKQKGYTARNIFEQQLSFDAIAENLRQIISR